MIAALILGVLYYLVFGSWQIGVLAFLTLAWFAARTEEE